MKVLIATFTLLFLFEAISQKKISNFDLRRNSEVFIIEDFSSDKSFNYKLESSNSGEFKLTQYKKNTKKIWKLSSYDATKMDELFSDEFISMKYMMGESNQNCKKVYKLSLRTEKYSVCGNDILRKKIVSKFITSIKKKYN